MFQHHGRLAPALGPLDYSSNSFFEKEQQGLFANNWNFFCLGDEVCRPGDCLARMVNGMPVVVQNLGGELHAFQNVCAHRHSLIAPPGYSQKERLKCLYHGWEYGKDGRVAKIPDGQSFKGIRPEALCLPKYRVERAGPIVFVNLSRQGATFREYLGRFWDEYEQYFGDHRHVWSWITEHPVNWKIIVENAVESYHVPCAHPETFANYRAEELHDHQLEPTYSRYLDLEPWDTSLVGKGFRALSGLLLRKPNYERFKHTHIYPNYLLFYAELFSTFVAVEPLGPKQSRYHLVGFVPRQIKFGRIGKMIQSVSTHILARQFRRILEEDMAIWPHTQAGLDHSGQRGVLSCREERVYSFQNYMVDSLRQSGAHSQMSGPDAAVRPEIAQT